MKSLKTYNLDHDVIQILSRSPNKSQYVCRAVRAWEKKEIEFDIRDISTRQLMATLQARDDCPRHIKIVLWDQLQQS